MAWGKTKTPEELAADEQRQALKQAESERREFMASPQGQARTAFERGDLVFQYEIDVMRQQAIIVAMVGSAAGQKTTDPSVVLNAVSREGWDLVTGSFVFIEEGQQSRDKFLASGQNVAIKGKTMGYYLFRRCEGNRAG